MVPLRRSSLSLLSPLHFLVLTAMSCASLVSVVIRAMLVFCPVGGDLWD